MLNDPEKEWENFGKNDPYYGVISKEKFRRNKMDPSDKEDFFASGEQHISQVLSTIQQHIRADFSPQHSLDFGCGVGRLLLPLATHSETVTGLDISPSMLAEAQTNCSQQHNIRLFQATQERGFSDIKYDLIHSYIVFQHIPVARGEAIFRMLLSKLATKGVCALHFTYAKATKHMEVVQKIKNTVPLASNFINLVNRRKFLSPSMQMNSYDLNSLITIAYQAGAEQLHLEHTNHDGHIGIMLYFQVA